MKTATRFKELLGPGSVLYVPGVWDGLSARMAEQAGFTALCSSGYAVAGSLGMPDAELYTATEHTQALRRITEASTLPVIADIDTGFGNAVNVMRTIRQFEDAGASAVFMEDQLSPKRCPICVGDPVPTIPLEEAAGKIRAARDAAAPSTVIVARTDSSGDEALRRLTAYAEAGADLVMPVTKTFSSIDEWKQVSLETGVPLLVSLTSGTWVERDFTPEVLRELNVQVALLPTQAVHVVAGALRSCFTNLRAGVAPSEVSAAGMSHGDYLTMIGFPEVEALQEKYLPSHDGLEGR